MAWTFENFRKNWDWKFNPQAAAVKEYEAEQVKAEAQKASKLRAALSALDPENKDRYTTLGSSELEGEFLAMGEKRSREKQNVLEQQAYMNIVRDAAAVNQLNRALAQEQAAQQQLPKFLEALNQTNQTEPTNYVQAPQTFPQRVTAAFEAAPGVINLPSNTMGSQLLERVLAQGGEGNDLGPIQYDPVPGIKGAIGWRRGNMAGVIQDPTVKAEAFGEGRGQITARDRLTAAQKTLDRISRIPAHLRTPEDKADEAEARKVVRELQGTGATGGGDDLWSEFLKTRK